jgi:hypothetical protein
MAVKLSALSTDRVLLPRIITFMLVVEAEEAPRPSAAGRIRQIEKNSFTSSGLEPATFMLVA